MAFFKNIIRFTPNLKAEQLKQKDKTLHHPKEFQYWHVLIDSEEVIVKLLDSGRGNSDWRKKTFKCDRQGVIHIVKGSEFVSLA